MKLKDYRRLGKISIKSRKKSTRHTVTGICFGLIMLIPIVYFTLGFYLGLTGKLDETATSSVFMISSRNAWDSGASIVDNSEYGGQMALMNFSTAEELFSDEKAEQRSAAEYYYITGQSQTGSNETLTVVIDGEPYYYKGGQNYYGGSDGGLKIVNTALSDAVFLDAEISDLAKQGRQPLLYGEGFSGGGKGQVLVSYKFLTAYGVADTESVIGKPLSLTVSSSKMIYGSCNIYIQENGETPDEEMNRQFVSFGFLKDFTVAGIISDDYYELASAKSEADIVVTSDSVYAPGYGEGEYSAFVPEINFTEQTDEQAASLYYNYPSGVAAMCEAAAADGRMALAYGALTPKLLNGFYNSYINYGTIKEANPLLIAPLNTRIDCGNYVEAQKFGQKIDAVYRVISPSMADSPVGAVNVYANSVYNNFFMLATVGKYMMFVLYTFGGIIFFATMLNLYNSVNYSVQARRNYMGVMRAIGAKQSMIPRLYFFEIILIFLRALPWVLIFSGGLSYLIKFAVDSIFRYAGDLFGSAITMEFSWYFVTLAAVVAAVFVIALLFSRIACKNVAGKPILEVLSDDKG